jgi:HK97 family phage portal protein
MAFFGLWKKNKPEQTKESRVARFSVLSSGDRQKTPDKDYEKFAKEVYLKNLIGFACIKERAQAASMVRWDLIRDLGNEKSEFISNHPISALLKKANPQEPFNFLVYKAIAFFALSGNSFIEKVSGQQKIPKELYCLRPDRIKQLFDANGRLEAYEYTINGGYSDVKYEIDPITMQSDLLHIRQFNPVNDFWGMSPIEPASRDLDTSNYATDWNLSMMLNQGSPGMVVTLVGEMDDEDFEEFERKLEEKFSGPANARRTMILTGDNGTKAEPYTFTPEEMQYIESNREIARRIALGFGVPPMLLGIPGDNTYSNQQSARQAFFETTVTFDLNMFTWQLNNWLFGYNKGKENLKIQYNMDDIPALEERWKIKWDRAQKADFLTINEKRELVGYDTISNGDVILIQGTMITLEQLLNPPEPLDQNDNKLPPKEPIKMITNLSNFLDYNKNIDVDEIRLALELFDDDQKLIEDKKSDEN